MGIDPKLAERLAANVREKAAVTEGPRPKASLSTKPRERGMNKTEARYADYLDALKCMGVLLWYAFETVKLRLADDMTYTPDFTILWADGRMSFVDVKAYWAKKGKPGITEDSLAKMKMAGEIYWMFTVKATWEFEGVWHERVF